MITYAENYTLLDRPCRPYGQNQFGYGQKIATHRMLRFNGERYLYRVYATCWSNVASHWIMRRGIKLHIR